MITTAIVYVPEARDLDAAAGVVAGRPVVFRAVAVAVRAGATRVLVPAVFREILAPALRAAPRVERAVVWIEPAPGVVSGAPAVPGSGSAAPAESVVLVPATLVATVPAVAPLFATRALATHASARASGAPLVTASPDVVRALWTMLREAEPAGAALEQGLARGPLATVVDGGLVHRVTDSAAARIAEAKLYTTIGSPIDTAWDRAFHRRVSRHVTRAAIACGITPNAVTIASGVVGLVAAWCFATPTPLFAALGVVVYAMAVVLDHSDGEVARLTLTESAIGEWLDIGTDTVIHAGVVFALGATSAAVSGRGAGLGLVGALGIVASAAVMKRWPAVAMPDRFGTSIAQLGSRDGFYAMVLGFTLAMTAAPAALPVLMVVIAAGSHAYWVSRLIYRVTRGA